MIVPMSKYYFVLHHTAHKAFLERLQVLGLVDITTSGWEPSEDDRNLISMIDKHHQAVTRLTEFAKRDGYVVGEQYDNGDEAFEHYLEASTHIDLLTAQAERLHKEAVGLKVWGNFDAPTLSKIAQAGIDLRYFFVYTKNFNENISEWSSQYTIEPISNIDGVTYFVVISDPGEDILINAQEIKAPTATSTEKYTQAKQIESQINDWEQILARCAESIDKIEAHGQKAKERLHFHKVSESGRSEADGTLIVLQGWATRSTALKVDKMLDDHPDMIYLKANPTPEDDTPVLLKNNRFAQLFEVIGGFYSLPKYGTMDLTPYFAPFYMIFFGFCLGEAGYGLILFLAGLFMLLKGGEKMNSIGKLTMICGGSTIVFGFMTGSFFGIQIADFGVFKEYRQYFLTPDNLFTLAIGLGIIQLLFGMVLNIVAITAQLGFKYAVARIGWLTILLSSIAAVGLPMIGINFTMSSPIYYALVGIGVFLMLFLNSPGKNPLMNIGPGLWNTYNDVSGLIGDVLSYIRLFAIGLSGGILALVFNDLAFGLSPDIPVIREISILIILLIGHSINLFMSTLSSFVHPMRLTFVEFYKNAGFEAGQRAFTPFKKEQ